MITSQRDINENVNIRQIWRQLLLSILYHRMNQIVSLCLNMLALMNETVIMKKTYKVVIHNQKSRLLLNISWIMLYH